jgi:hypothetical protein
MKALLAMRGTLQEYSVLKKLRAIADRRSLNAANPP